jgi:hypothetical protein
VLRSAEEIQRDPREKRQEQKREETSAQEYQESDLGIAGALFILHKDCSSRCEKSH